MLKVMFFCKIVVNLFDINKEVIQLVNIEGLLNIMKTDFSVAELEQCLSEGQKIQKYALLALTQTSTVYAVTLKEEYGCIGMAVKLYNKGQAPPPILSHLLGKPFKHLVAIHRLTLTQPASLCMELCSQDLKDFSRSEGQQRLSGQEVQRVGCQILQGLLSLKSLRLMHGDLKPENILIDFSSTIKIGDLDFVLRYRSAKYSQEEFSRKKIRVGTLQYMAPEVLSQWSCSYSSDMWSFGVVMYELYFGQHPFPSIVQLDHSKDTSITSAVTIIKDLLDKTRKHIKRCIEECSQPLPKAILESILKCLVWSPSSRSQAEQVVRILQGQSMLNLGVFGGTKQRKGSWSTDCSIFHQEDDIFMFSNSGLLLAFEQFHTILSSLPQEAPKFKDILAITNRITQRQIVAAEEIMALRTLIEPKYRKIQRNFKRLAHLQGGVGYSKKGQLFIHLKYLMELLAEPIADCKQWTKENSVKSAELLQ